MSNQQYRHTNRKLTPAELVDLLTDQHSGWVDDPIMLWLSQSLEDMAEVVSKAIICEDDDALAAAREFIKRRESFDAWRQS